MMTEEELETHLPALDAATYRRLWLDEAHQLGLVAETLAEVLGWQPREGEWLPDALELAEAAAITIDKLAHDAMMERGNSCRSFRRKYRKSCARLATN